MAQTLRPPKAPNILVAPVEYMQHYQHELNNAFRLYFNQIDNAVGVIMENSGGRFISSPHLYSADTTTQYAAGDNTATVIDFNTVDSQEGFSFNTGTGVATPDYNGSYRVDYRLQVENSDSSPHSIYVWLKINGADVTNSCTKFTIPANTGVDSYIVCESFIQVNIDGASGIQLYWATDKAATSGGGLGVYLEAYPAQVSPFAAPAIPSAYGSITFVSELSQ